MGADSPLAVQEPARRPASSRKRPLLVVEGLRAEHGGRHDSVAAVRDVSFSVRPANASPSSESRGAARRRSRAASSACTSPRPDACSWTARPSRRGQRGAPREARRRIQIVFQNPNDSLNPRHRVGDAIARPARLLRDLSAREARPRWRGSSSACGFPPRVADRYPGELSGGERQRVAIARALAARPDLVVCDEITSALDVSVQAAVLELLAELRAELRLALLFITHDLGVVASIADRVLVLEGGIVCEDGPVPALLQHPEHEYTRRLVEAAPRLPRLTEVA